MVGTMGTLRDIVGDGEKRKEVVAKAIEMVDAEVSDKGGLSGMAIKTAYAMVKGLAPGMMQKLMNGLLDDFMGALDPFHEEAKQKGTDVKAHLVSRQADVANALLSITDKRAARATQGTLKKGYEKLRPTAQKHVEQAVPRLGELVKSVAP
jgi:hypothetical protein